MFALMLYTSASNRQTSEWERGKERERAARGQSRPVCRQEEEAGRQAAGRRRLEQAGDSGTQKRCLAGHLSMVGFLHVQFVYLNSFHFNYEGIPFNI